MTAVPAVPAVPLDLADALARVADARTHLQSAEAALADARRNAAAVIPSEFSTPATYRAAVQKAERVIAERSMDASFYSDLVAQAEAAHAPLAIEDAKAKLAVAIESRHAAVAQVAGVIEALGAALVPVLDTVRAIAAGQQAVAVALRDLSRLGERAVDPAGSDREVIEQAGRVVSKLRDAQATSAQVVALVDLVKYVEAEPERAAARKQAQVDKAHAAYMKWRGEALKGEHGAADQKKAEAEVRAANEAFYGKGPAVERAKLSPELKRYYDAAGIKVEG